MNLVAISFDRYLAISRPFRYYDLMTPKRGRLLVALVWIVSFLICCPPLLGWKEPGQLSTNMTVDAPEHTLELDFESEYQRPLGTRSFNNTYRVRGQENQSEAMINLPDCGDPYPECNLTSDPGYIVYSALGSFYIPSIFLVFFYAKIYHIAVRTTNALNTGMLTIKANNKSLKGGDSPIEMRVHRGGGARRTHGVSSAPGHHTSFSSTTSSLHGTRTSFSSTTSSLHGTRTSFTSTGSSVIYNRSTPSLKQVSEENSRRKPINPQYSKCSSRDVIMEVPTENPNMDSRWTHSQPNATDASSTPLIPMREIKSNHYTQTSEASKNDSNRHDSHTDSDQDANQRTSLDTSGADESQLIRTTSLNVHKPSRINSINKNKRCNSFGRNTSFINRRRLSSRMSKRSFDNLLAEAQAASTGSDPTKIKVKKHTKRDIKRTLKYINKEKRAAKTVAIIIGCFIICWLPFFTIYFFGAFCNECTPKLLFSIFFWLGYCNSALNPFIYAYFSRDFRSAFKRLLSCKCTCDERKRASALMALFTGFRFSTRNSDSNSE